MEYQKIKACIKSMISIDRHNAQTAHQWTHILSNILTALVCVWIAFCTSIGPLYRANESITNFGVSNALLFITVFVFCMVLIHIVSHKRQPACDDMNDTHHTGKFNDWILQHTSNSQQIMTLLLIGWLWAWVTLLSNFGADLVSQNKEVRSWLATIQGSRIPYMDGYTVMDVYPIAHYLWPNDPTFLTDHHNLPLTVLYGGVMAFSRYLTGVSDLGVIALSGLQLVFAAFCCAATANRFFQPRQALNIPQTDTSSFPAASPLARIITMVTLLICPITVFSTISLTKSPLFAWACLWWIGVGYEIHLSRKIDRRLPRQTLWALTLSSIVMLCSAKYAIYILLFQLMTVVITDHKHWKTYFLCLLLPILVYQGTLAALFNTGHVIPGDSIEARSIQLQQIARVAQRNPSGIPEQARLELDPIMDLHAASRAYFPNDADSVKSSGNQTRRTVYRWKTVTAEDMSNFNRAWAQIGIENPTIYLDALLAESYGYFDCNDIAYVPMSYYVNNGYVQDDMTWISGWCHNWRDFVAGFARNWAKIPVLGWPTRGNFWVIATLLLIACEVLQNRWRSLIYQLPLLLLMGVMIVSPANNFERHMLPLVFAFPFLVIAYHRDSVNENQGK